MGQETTTTSLTKQTQQFTTTNTTVQTEAKQEHIQQTCQTC